MQTPRHHHLALRPIFHSTPNPPHLPCILRIFAMLTCFLPRTECSGELGWGGCGSGCGHTSDNEWGLGPGTDSCDTRDKCSYYSPCDNKHKHAETSPIIKHSYCKY